MYSVVGSVVTSVVNRAVADAGVVASVADTEMLGSLVLTGSLVLIVLVKDVFVVSELSVGFVLDFDVGDGDGLVGTSVCEGV